MPDRFDITECLGRMRDGDPSAARELATLVYGDLKERAERFARQSPGGAVSATTLVHEAYLRLIDGAALKAGGREHLLALSSKIMRDLLVDMARKRAAEKRGGHLDRLSLSTDGLVPLRPVVDVLGVHEALNELAAYDARMAQIVEMRYFGGMVGDEIAAHLGVTRRTVTRELTMAQAWLRKALASAPRDLEEP